VTLSTRDRRALILLGVAVAAMAMYLLASSGDPEVVEATTSIPAVEKRLLRLRQVVASAPVQAETLKRAEARAAEAEKDLIQAETAAQAQAQVLQIARRLCRSQSPPVEIRSVELGQIRPLGDDYGEALVTVSFEAQIHQLVQLLADVTAQPELVATEDLRVNAADARQKTMQVRLTISGVVPRKLVPEKKGLGRL
jgi:hypothetical protein